MTRMLITLKCPDMPGLVHAVCGGVLEMHGNIVENEQFTDPDTNLFLLRMLVESEESDPAALRAAIVARLPVDAELAVRREPSSPRVLILVSKFDHCLRDLLYRWESGALPVTVVAVASNHQDCERIATQHGVPFLYMPIDSRDRAAQEREIRSFVEAEAIDLVVLARYMQVLSEGMCAFLGGRAINIHHSFLPGFKGAKPYHQAHERGVKLIGATAHFVTSQLDEGPIIEQDVVRVSHSSTADQLVELGRDVERLVLARAVRLWAERRVFLLGTKTVVLGR